MNAWGTANFLRSCSEFYSYLACSLNHSKPKNKNQLKCPRAVHPQPGDRHNGVYTAAVQHPSSLRNLAINWNFLCSLPSLHLLSWEMTNPSPPSCSTLLERRASDCRRSFPIHCCERFPDHFLHGRSRFRPGKALPAGPLGPFTAPANSSQGRNDMLWACLMPASLD